MERHLNISFQFVCFANKLIDKVIDVKTTTSANEIKERELSSKKLINKLIKGMLINKLINKLIERSLLIINTVYPEM